MTGHIAGALRLSWLIVLVSTAGVTAGDEFLLSKDQAGPIRTGMEVDALYGKIDWKLTKLVDLHSEGFFVPALEIYLSKDETKRPALVARIGLNFVVTSITVYDTRFKTAKGIGVGSTLGEIRKEHKIDSIGFGEGPLCARVNEIGMTFALDFRNVPRAWYKTGDQALIPDSAKVTSVLVVN